MQTMNFEAIVKNGYIKLPEKYSRLNNKKIFVKILNGKPDDIPDRSIKMKKFLSKYSGLLKDAKIQKTLI